MHLMPDVSMEESTLKKKRSKFKVALKEISKMTITNEEEDDEYVPDTQQVKQMAKPSFKELISL